ncbi:hypothetical protein BBI11_00670 [Planococcus maritimus]|uniref:hypothetical protein n=1 Tax=Planococcus maritimus TaxID=192421 RepID=UPI00080F031E|nr:hypothetical protein [Planococcus maritimus]ANU15692.1 hypothetical protein BBI11_00670 [Planococcus maritimus]
MKSIKKTTQLGDGALQNNISSQINEEALAQQYAHSPHFLTIKARQIEQWANSQIESRSLLPVLLRKLVHSTGGNLSHVNFPGYDNGQRKGSDGFVKAGVATPWIPEGESYWEFGTDQKINSKAEADYNARLTTVDPTVRANSTFVFVTPRNWPGNKTWETQKNEESDWKAVRVFDASDLEQWLEQSIPAQVWFAEQLDLPISGYETLEMVWDRWSNASDPPLTTAIFTSSIVASRDLFKEWINNSPSRPFVVAADSKGEALAFLSCLFEEEEFQHLKDVATIFRSPEALRTLVKSTVPFIPIIHSEDTEREILNAHLRLHCIIIRPRNAVDVEADVRLDILNYPSFKNALISMGVEEEEVPRLARESGQSPTILRRRLSKNAAIRKPIWAGEDKAAKNLIPMALIGAWQSEKEADREVISKVANCNYEEIEIELARFLRFDDSPVWSVGRFRGVVSKIDVLFAVERLVTAKDLEQFFSAAEYVLSESDPALELPEKDRWAAALYDKTRNHSDALRKGICETLVILAVYGSDLFYSRLGVEVESRVAILVRKLLTPLTLEKLISHERDLPLFAEAAPSEFLKIIRNDLRYENPIVLNLLKPVDNSLFGRTPSRTGLLWGLEYLAWKPQNLLQVSLILARLSQSKIDDNWVNTPETSLKAIFRSWMPQTGATLEQRCKVLEKLTERYPDISWDIAIDQIKPGSEIGHYSHRPHWRNEASGAGQVVTYREYFEFKRYALDLLINWPAHDEETLSDLVKYLQSMLEEDQNRIWDLIDQWSKDATEVSKALLRERIRQFAFIRESNHQELKEVTHNRARIAYDNLRIQNPIVNYSWLFTEQWVNESPEEIEDNHFDFQQYEARIDSLRMKAVIEIWNDFSFEGIKELMDGSNAPEVIGRYITLCIPEFKQRVDFIEQCLSINDELKSKTEQCLKGFIYSIEEDLRIEILKATAKDLTDEARKKLFICAPFNESTWRLIEDDNKEIYRFYWQTVLPFGGSYTSAELIKLVDCLLEAQRPRAAFHAAQRYLDSLETSRLKLLLHDVATVDAEPLNDFKLEKHQISKAFEVLSKSVEITQNEIAKLEFLFIEILYKSKHGIPNLEAQVIESPLLFVQAVTLVYNRQDKREDLLEWKVENPEKHSAVAYAANLLLESISKIPGTDTKGMVDVAILSNWLSEVRRLCGKYGRLEAGDRCIGKLLAKAPVGVNGIWPCPEVCEVMEDISSTEIARGFLIGVHNSQGFYWGGEGGERERKLAAKYNKWTESLFFEYPYVGTVIKEIADSYNWEAQWHDSEEKIAKRLQDRRQ